MKNIFNIILEIIMIIFMIIGILIWCGIIFVGIKECYDINPTSLYVVIPLVILVHIFGILGFICNNKL